MITKGANTENEESIRELTTDVQMFVEVRKDRTRRQKNGSEIRRKQEIVGTWKSIRGNKCFLE